MPMLKVGRKEDVARSTHSSMGFPSSAPCDKKKATIDGGPTKH